MAQCMGIRNSLQIFKTNLLIPPPHRMEIVAKVLYLSLLAELWFVSRMPPNKAGFGSQQQNPLLHIHVKKNYSKFSVWFFVNFCHVVATWISEVGELSWGLWALRITTQLHTLDTHRDSYYLKLSFALGRNMIWSTSESYFRLSGNLHWVSCVSSVLPGRQAIFLWSLNFSVCKVE